MQTVLRSSATYFVNPEDDCNNIQVAADHSKLVKFSDRNDGTYLIVCNKIRAILSTDYAQRYRIEHLFDAGPCDDSILSPSIEYAKMKDQCSVPPEVSASLSSNSMGIAEWLSADTTASLFRRCNQLSKANTGFFTSKRLSHLRNRTEELERRLTEARRELVLRSLAKE